MLVYYFVPFVSNRYLLFWVSNGHNSVTEQNRTHVYMNFFDHKDLGNHLLQLCPKVVKHPVYTNLTASNILMFLVSADFLSVAYLGFLVPRASNHNACPITKKKYELIKNHSYLLDFLFIFAQ